MADTTATTTTTVATDAAADSSSAATSAAAGDTPPAPSGKVVLLVGATGSLGGLVVPHLLEKGYRVRALVRPSSKTDALAAQTGVEVVRGDMMKPETLGSAFEGVSAVVTTAAGYVGRKRGDSIQTDVQGNRNLVDAAKKANVGVFVLCSILQCDNELAKDVPHFRAKAEIEAYLAEQGVPFVSLRPGAFLMPLFHGKKLQKNVIPTGSNPDIPMTFVGMGEVARCLAASVDEPRALNKKIDLGTDRSISTTDLAKVCSELLNRPVKVERMPTFIMSTLAIFMSRWSDFRAMFRFMDTGKYVADTTLQAELFGHVDTVEEAAKKLIDYMKIQPTPKPAPQPAAEEPKPAAEEPKPAAEEPKPAAEEPKPAAEEPKPVAEEPKPAAEEPKPAAEEPKPAAEEPKPVAEEPKPAAEEPKPAAEEPKPAAEEPKPAAEEPKPAAEEPKPAAEEPKPAAEEPKPAAEEPKPAAEEPKPAAEEPKPAAEEPKPAAEEHSEPAAEPAAE